MQLSYKVFLAVLVLGLLAPVPAAAKRPGRAWRRIKPIPEELVPLPPNVVAAPLPERNAVEIPIAEVTAPIFTPEGVPVEQAITPTAGCGSYTETDIRPLRTQWNSYNGYCGEMSLQLVAMTRGIYISQKIARRLGVPSGANHTDLLFDGRNSPSGVYGVAKMLGLYQPPESYWFIDNMLLSPSKHLTPGPNAFANWIKQNVLAGKPVIGGFRVNGGGYEDYDHIMPVFGICHTNAAVLGSGDVFVLTDNYQSELRHTPGDGNFYASYGNCRYTGCIPNDWWDMGVAVGPLNVPSGVFFPVKVEITGWSDSSSVHGEPGEYRDSTAKGSYKVTVSGLTAGQTYRLYRTTGLFPNYQIPQSAAALAAACTAQGTAGCRSITFTAPATSVVVTETSKGTVAGALELGKFPALGVTYFLAVRA